MSWKSKSIIPFRFIKIYHENCLVDHDVPTRQNAHNWTFSGKGTSLYPTWMYFSMYDNVLESKLGTTAIIIRWFVTVSPWFVKNCPHATISFLRWFCILKHIFQTFNHCTYDIQGNTCGTKCKYNSEYKWDVYKPSFCTMSPRNKYDQCRSDGIAQNSSKMRLHAAE